MDTKWGAVSGDVDVLHWYGVVFIDLDCRHWLPYLYQEDMSADGPKLTVTLKDQYVTDWTLQSESAGEAE